jgi:hypothetical protein
MLCSLGITKLMWCNAIAKRMSAGSRLHQRGRCCYRRNNLPPSAKALSYLLPIDRDGKNVAPRSLERRHTHIDSRDPNDA